MTPENDNIEEIVAERDELRAKLGRLTQLSSDYERLQDILNKHASDNTSKVQEQAAYINALDRENQRLASLNAEGERAIVEIPRLREKLKAAEKARAAAERVAEEARSARGAAQAELERLQERIVELQEQPSRLKRLRDEVGL